jgi:hypothetical protein
MSKDLHTYKNLCEEQKKECGQLSASLVRCKSREIELKDRLAIQIAQNESLDVALTEATAKIEQLEADKKELAVAAEENLEKAIGKKRKLEVDPKHCGKPLHFDGKSPNVRDWLMNLELYFELMADSIPSNCQVGTAATYLKGEALRFWHFRLKQLEEHEKTDMNMFQRSLIERFDSANDPIAARYKLDKLQQGDNAMRVHVQTFDTLCSYIPDMADGEKIHRFLTTVRAECSKVLCNDPSTGARWAQYADMRRYALNQYAHEKNFRPVNPRTDMLQAAMDKLGGKPPRKKHQQHWHLQKRTADREQGEGSGGGRRGSDPSSSRSKVYTFYDRNGRDCERPISVKNFCMGKGLCGICYQKGHLSTECTLDKMKSGSPPGMNR